MGVGRLTAGGWNAEVYYTVIHIVIPLSCVYVAIASCLWSMMFIQHCFLILCSFAVHRTHTVHVCINASLGCPFNSNIGGG